MRIGDGEGLAPLPDQQGIELPAFADQALEAVQVLAEGQNVIGRQHPAVADIVPADSFYEWKKVKTGKKPKYEFTVPGRESFGMAGRWSRWKNTKTGVKQPTFAKLTSEANGTMQPVHDREPTILEPRDYKEWLSERERPPVNLLRLLPEEEMKERVIESADAATSGQGALFEHH